jgi:quinol monooxygenase YgiN
MAVLEVCRRRLHPNISPNDPALKSILPQIRENTGVQYVFYSAIEETEIFFMIGQWSSIKAYDVSLSSPDRAAQLALLDAISTTEWIEHIPMDALTTLPLKAPIMTVSRCLFKEYDDHPRRYFTEVQTLVSAIEAETRPWRYIGDWAVDTTEDRHKWIVFGGWRSKKHHQVFATKLRESTEWDFFGQIPEHYDFGTVHRHCWDMENRPDPEAFEVMDGYIQQIITPGRG